MRREHRMALARIAEVPDERQEANDEWRNSPLLTGQCCLPSWQAALDSLLRDVHGDSGHAADNVSVPGNRTSRPSLRDCG